MPTMLSSLTGVPSTEPSNDVAKLPSALTVALLVVVSVLVVVLVFFAGPEFNAERIAKQNSIEVSGEDYVPDAEFEVDAYPEVNNLIKTLQVCTVSPFRNTGSYKPFIRSHWSPWDNLEGREMR